MRRRDWLLLFAAYSGAPDGLDPIRFQKGLFLFAECSDAPARSKYEFKPYDYGPMSREIYRDLDQLVAEGLLAQVAVPGKRWCRYKQTPATFSEAKRIVEQAKAQKQVGAAQQLYDIKQEVAGMGFGELLEKVYSEHPEFAVKSIFRSHA